MKGEQDIQAKIKELEEKLEEMDEEYQDELENQGLDEFSAEGSKLEEEFGVKKEVIEDQIKILKWVLE